MVTMKTAAKAKARTNVRAFGKSAVDKSAAAGTAGKEPARAET
jgi:hypothetical protein